MADHVRAAIFDLAGVPQSARDALMKDPFDKPLGDWPFVKYMRGVLVGDSPNLVREGNKYPFLRWNPLVTSYTLNAAGKLDIQFTEDMTAELADGISFEAGSFEIWKAG